MSSICYIINPVSEKNRIYACCSVKCSMQQSYSYITNQSSATSGAASRKQKILKKTGGIIIVSHCILHNSKSRQFHQLPVDNQSPIHSVQHKYGGSINSRQEMNVQLHVDITWYSQRSLLSTEIVSPTTAKSVPVFIQRPFSHPPMSRFALFLSSHSA
jgi:hypothetical protein